MKTSLTASINLKTVVKVKFKYPTKLQILRIFLSYLCLVSKESFKLARLRQLLLDLEIKI